MGAAPAGWQNPSQMSATLVAVSTVVLVALIFDLTNGSTTRRT
jgi:hypothetical protein